MHFGDSESAISLVQRHRGGGVDALGGEVGAAELSAERHGEASGVGGGQQLLWIRPDAALKARTEAVLRLFQDAAVG